ncbi:HAD family hydrolase [Clostridium ganghwense]|uniref:HAD family phosphatase n=1 Tax=Clostridium ganghwense TaxID=312089 RepID=A0ABT4CTC0_9CLOT|nr:HAD family phosphatase [Clostridium ganghwense]MCY6372294.1 HAD family phosphatase [Clostridium ganghwense]
MIKYVIFDMDGVIIDSEPIHFKLEQKLFKSYGIEVSAKEHDTFIGSTSYYMWDSIRNKYKLSQDLEELVQKDRREYFELLSSSLDTEPIEGVCNLIKELYEKGIKIAVASSSPLDVIELVLKKFKISEYFDFIITGDFVEKSKPEPDIFLYAANKLGAKTENCVVIEDSHNGVRAAKKAGMKCIGYKNLNSGKQDLSMADRVIHSYSEIGFDELQKI